MSLPGAEIVEQGLMDLAEGLPTIEALLVAIGAPRLRQLGLAIPQELPDQPEHRHYDRLAEEDWRRAHSRYNALIHRLVSYERAAEAERGRRLRMERDGGR